MNEFERTQKQQTYYHEDLNPFVITSENTVALSIPLSSSNATSHL